MQGMLSPSIMCADLMNLQSDIDKLESLGVEYVHIDFMDGKFVPNITFGTDIVRAFKGAVSNMKRDIHIMAFEPQQYFDKMQIGENDLVSVHLEACENIGEVIADIKSRGASAALAISPDTPVAAAKEYLGAVDAVLVMTVYPGFAGQPLAPHSFERIAEMKKIIEETGLDIPIEVDGNVSWDHCVKMRESGANIFVAGSSSVFGKGGLEENIKRFYELVK